MSTAVIWSKSKPDIEFQYGERLGEFHGMSSQSHLPHCRVLPPGEFNVVIPQPCTTLQGAATWWIHCHDSRATCHIAGCNNSIRHIDNRFSPYFIFLVSLMQFGLWRAAAFVSSPIHLLLKRYITWQWHAINMSFYNKMLLNQTVNTHSWQASTQTPRFRMPPKLPKILPKFNDLISPDSLKLQNAA